MATLEGKLGAETYVFRFFAHSGTDAGRREWDELQRIWPKMQSGDLRVCRPVCLCADGQVLVVEKLPGKTLRECLKNPKPDNPAKLRRYVDCRLFEATDRDAVRNRNAAYLEQTARWLRLYTASTERWQDVATARWLKAAAMGVEKQGCRQLREVEIDILSELKRIAPLLDGEKWRTAKCHGDFHPSNLIVHEGRMTGFDTGFERRALIYKDIAGLLTSPGARRPDTNENYLLGVDRAGLNAFFMQFDMTEVERNLITPFMIGCQALMRGDRKRLKRFQIKRDLNMFHSILRDLKNLA